MKRWVIASGLIVGLTLSALGGWVLYQNHLSGDLRVSLVAASDPTASEADILSYLRTARLQIRTKKDGEMFAKFEQIYQLLTDANEIQSRQMQELTARLRSSSDDPCMKFSSDAAEERRFIERCDSYSEDRKRMREISDMETERAKSEEAQGKKLYTEFRKELGLAPLPSH
jgi:hypothetical protein